jgi:hypothetical protein
MTGCAEHRRMRKAQNLHGYTRLVLVLVKIWHLLSCDRVRDCRHVEYSNERGNGEPDSIKGNISAWANPKQKTLLALN